MIHRKFIQFILIKRIFSFIFLDLGGLYDEHTVNQQFSGAYTPEYTVHQESLILLAVKVLFNGII